MKRNAETILLLAILILLSTGVELGDSFQPARIAILAAFLWTLTRPAPACMRSRVQSLLLLLGGGWILWGLISLSWTPDVANGGRELTGIALGLITAFTIMRLAARAPRGLWAIRMGWVWAFACTLPIVAVEVLYDQHMPGARGHDVMGGTTLMSITYAATTFGNRNTYSAFLVLALPFLLWNLQHTCRWRKLVMILLIAAAICIQLLNASRLGAAATCCELLVWLTLTRRGKVKLALAVTTVLLLVSFGNLIDYLPYTQVRYRVVLSGQDASVMSRAGLLRNGLQFLADTAGAGIGAGGFVAGIASGRGGADTLGAVDPHNVWIEVAAQYGLLIGLAFPGWLACGAWTLWRARRRRYRASVPEVHEGTLYALMVLSAVPFNGLMNSGYITFTFFWAALGSIAAIAAQVERAGSQSRRRIVIWKVVPLKPNEACISR
jgi:hypothetical protein